MFLFIFDSIGTSELLLVGIVALMFLGPRRLPEMAKKIGKIMAEFRGTANEFKETWQREVNFEEEAKAFDLNNLEADVVDRKTTPPTERGPAELVEAPTVKEVDPEAFKDKQSADKEREDIPGPAGTDDKATWL